MDSAPYYYKKSPVIKIDIGSQVFDHIGVGVSDISRTFFFNKNNIENSAKDRYEKCITLYNYIVNLVNELATSLSIGQSGNDIFNYAESLFNRIIIEPCLANGIIEFPNELLRFL